MEIEWPAHAQIELNVRSPAKLIETRLDAIPYRSVVRGISKTIHIHWSRERYRAPAFRLKQGCYFESSGHVNSPGENETVRHIFTGRSIVPFRERIERIANAIHVIEKLA